MDKTKTMIYFEITAPDLDTEAVTKQLGMTPSESYHKGDLIEDSFYHYRKRGSWSISSGYQEDLFMDESYKKVIDPLREKTALINQLRTAYDATCRIVVVSEMFNGQAPALLFPADVVQFAADVHAEIDIDLYPCAHQT
ncbi:hypothetical protein KP77_09970 [Jeotgalibacillus alimentarius]|uniref:DUF4279 domain-containing protein n=1 Tax=Jeotgalibacillus alimentarius TaxID=135826 RepID=A0A0C2RML8_9BACL|nr:DUF4279 domain-containing protein [Jeotgalibacillus alimentarius]KIL51485.1 hypothetical protein KP77_09970 [Jeotgalibacillus alimentarius]